MRRKGTTPGSQTRVEGRGGIHGARGGAKRQCRNQPGEADVAKRESGATVGPAAGMPEEPVVMHRCQRDDGVGRGKGKQAPRRVNVPVLCPTSCGERRPRLGGWFRSTCTRTVELLHEWRMHAVGPCCRHAPRVCRTTSPRAHAGVSRTHAGTVYMQNADV